MMKLFVKQSFHHNRPSWISSCRDQFSNELCRRTLWNQQCYVCKTIACECFIWCADPSL